MHVYINIYMYCIYTAESIDIRACAFYCSYPHLTLE